MDDERLHIDETIWQRGIASLAAEDRALLQRVRLALPLAADVSRSDVFLVLPDAEDQVCVAVHAQPYSMPSLYVESPVGRCYGSAERRWLWTAITHGLRRQRIEPEVPDESPEVGQQVWPVLSADRRPVAAVVVYTNVIERERHRRRDPAFQRALMRFLQTVAAGQIGASEALPPFREQDGIVFVDSAGRYRYLSGQANNVYRRLGYLDDLRGRSVSEVDAGDLSLLRRAWESQTCVSSEDTVRGRILVRTAIPLMGQPDYTLGQRLRLLRSDGRYGALLLVKDLTEPRRKAQELRVKGLMIKEVHHRVKNNLQMLVSIMRMQARRAATEEARTLLYESINRILSMSAIHESLSEGEDQVLNLRHVIQRIISQMQVGMVAPVRGVQLHLAHADDVFLPTNRATACALAVNELLLNAVEHGFYEQEGGKIQVYVHDCGDRIEIQVVDTGHGLPADFSLDATSSLGLDIVRTLVHDDLSGTFELISRPEAGTQAVVSFPRAAPGGVS